MSDFFAAVGLLFCIEGIVFAAFPEAAKRAMGRITTTPENVLRLTGLLSALFGIVIVWMVRG